MLAVLKAGGAFVPLDPSHPVERLRALCDSIGAKLMLCSRHHLSKLTRVLDTVLSVDDETTVELTLAESEGGVVTGVPTASSTNAAYVIFTSGSTGKPKVS